MDPQVLTFPALEALILLGCFVGLFVVLAIRSATTQQSLTRTAGRTIRKTPQPLPNDAARWQAGFDAWDRRNRT